MSDRIFNDSSLVPNQPVVLSRRQIGFSQFFDNGRFQFKMDQVVWVSMNHVTLSEDVLKTQLTSLIEPLQPRAFKMNMASCCADAPIKDFRAAARIAFDSHEIGRAAVLLIREHFQFTHVSICRPLMVANRIVFSVGTRTNNLKSVVLARSSLI